MLLSSYSTASRQREMLCWKINRGGFELTVTSGRLSRRSGKDRQGASGETGPIHWIAGFLIKNRVQ